MKTLIALVTALVWAGALQAETQLAWPQFRGPNGSGVTENEKPPVEIGPEKNVKWKVAAPSGLSSPIVADDLLVITAFENEALFTIAYRREDGSDAWRAAAPAQQIEPYYAAESSPAASTPATDGERIVSYFGSCGLVCYDTSGKELWKFELPKAVTAGDFGSGVSPIIVDGTVVLVRDQIKDSKIYAVNLASGKPKWQKERQSPASYATPVVWETPEGKQIVAAGHARMTGYDLQSGEEKWAVNGLPSGCCSSPVTSDGILYFAGWSPGGPDDTESQMPPYDSLVKDLDKNKDDLLSREEAEEAFQGFFDTQDTNKDGFVSREEYDSLLRFMAEGKNIAFALRAGGSGDITSSHMLWKQTKGLPYVPSAILYRGQYVMVKDGGIVTAFDADSGDQIYQRRAAGSGNYYASPVAANGHIYFTALDGVITALKAGTDKPVVVAKNPTLDERTAATPAIANNTLYVRTEKHLYAFKDE